MIKTQKKTGGVVTGGRGAPSEGLDALLGEATKENVSDSTWTTTNTKLKSMESQNIGGGELVSNSPPPKAAINLNKALDKQKEKFVEVDEFLTTLAMDKYKETFIENGIEDLETILELEDEHFQSMSIPLGHKLKMLKRIKELKPTAPPPVLQKPSAGGKVGNIGEKNQPGALFQGKLDEGDAHNEFLQAREEWLKDRNNSNTNNGKVYHKINIEFIEESKIQ